MELTLDRDDATVDRTIGVLRLHGTFSAFTLEPPLAALAPLEDHPAIPAGRYRVDITPSVRFRRMLPLICNVPGRSGIRVHAGNVAGDSTGCVLVGLTRAHDSVQSSMLALAALQPQIAGALARHEDVWLTITDPHVSGTVTV